MQDSKIVEALRNKDFSAQVLSKALQLSDDAQERLFGLARECRQSYFKDNIVQARSVIEISNVCSQKCRYCAIGGKDQTMNYTLGAGQIEMLVDYLYEKGRRVVLLQSGENKSPKFIADTAEAVERVKKKYSNLRIILCMGNLAENQYKQLFDAGASDYILKFESSNSELFSRCKPNDTLEHRLNCIRILCNIGYRVGSGNIVGLPGQTIDDLVADLQLLHALPLEMNSTTIFIPAERSAFEKEPVGNHLYTLNMMALMRIMNPHRLMPTTSSLEKTIRDGQFLGLMAGANTITIHDGTPEELQQHFPIYSSKRIRPQAEHFRDILQRAGLSTINVI